MFDDSRLESPELTDSETLRWLATAGARIRRAAQTRPIGHLDRADRPRGILVLGTEARLVRAVLEPACPVPFMAWPGPGLPAWVGPLDLAVVLQDVAVRERAGDRRVEVGAAVGLTVQHLQKQAVAPVPSRRPRWS